MLTIRQFQQRTLNKSDIINNYKRNARTWNKIWDYKWFHVRGVNKDSKTQGQGQDQWPEVQGQGQGQDQGLNVQGQDQALDFQDQGQDQGHQFKDQTFVVKDNQWQMPRTTSL